MLNLTTGAGWEITKEGDAREATVGLRRYNAEGKYEELFVGRFKHLRNAYTLAAEYAKNLTAAERTGYINLTTCTETCLAEFKNLVRPDLAKWVRGAA